MIILESIRKTSDYQNTPDASWIHFLEKINSVVEDLIPTEKKTSDKAYRGRNNAKN